MNTEQLGSVRFNRSPRRDDSTDSSESSKTSASHVTSRTTTPEPSPPPFKPDRKQWARRGKAKVELRQLATMAARRPLKVSKDLPRKSLPERLVPFRSCLSPPSRSPSPRGAHARERLPNGKWEELEKSAIPESKWKLKCYSVPLTFCLKCQPNSLPQYPKVDYPCALCVGPHATPLCRAEIPFL